MKLFKKDTDRLIIFLVSITTSPTQIFSQESSVAITLRIYSMLTKKKYTRTRPFILFWCVYKRLCTFSKLITIWFRNKIPCQTWGLGKKYDCNFIFIFAVEKVRYGGITTAKIIKHGNYLK